MSKEIQKRIANIEKRLDNLEAQNQAAQPNDEQPPMEAAQETHQAALTSFNTERKDGMNLSTAGVPIPQAEIDAFLQGEKKKNEQHKPG